jgi:peptidoglycan lytic transglycosylase
MFTVRAKMIAVGLLGAAAIVPVDSAKAEQRGHASWYSLPANKTANGERMNPNDLTAAHRSLPFGTRVLVENLSNGQSVVVRINDRGPFTGGRIIDLSKAAAASIGMIASGVANVRVSVAEGGVLAELGESTAKENVTSRIKGDLIAVAQRDETPAVSAKMAGTDTNEAKAAPKPSGKTKIAAKTAKTKVLAAASAAKKRAASQTVKVAAKRSRPNESAKGRVQLAAANSGIRAAGREASRFSSRRTIVASARLREAGREAAKLSSGRTVVASAELRETGRKASKISSRRINVASKTQHPYPVLGTTPGFMKQAQLRERRATG